MLGLIVYFAVIGIDLDDKPTKIFEGEILVEKFENLGENEDDLDKRLAKEKVKDKVIENEYATAHHKVVKTLSSLDRDKKCRDKAEHTCKVDPNCIWCLGPDKGCLVGAKHRPFVRAKQGALYWQQTRDALWGPNKGCFVGAKQGVLC